MAKEINAVIKRIVIEEITFDLITQFETVLVLSHRPDLIGFCVLLKFYNQINLLTSLNQKQLAILMGLTEPTFIKRRKELEVIGLLEVKVEGNHRIYRLKFFKNLKFFKCPKSFGQTLDYLDKSRKSLTISSEETQQLTLNPIIYNNILSLKSKNKYINNKNIKRYPKEYYTIVLRAFSKYKGVKLSGPEIPQHLRPIKMMFKANHKPKEIVDFMKWLHDHEDDERTSWARLWTIWTVQKKIPEFLAGKLKSPKMEDEYPTYE